MNTVIITEKLNTHDHGHMYHQKVGKIGMEIGMEYSYTNTIIRKLFDRNFTYSRKILAMEPRVSLRLCYQQCRSATPYGA